MVGGVSVAQHGLKPPLVSLVLVNFNYEAFVGEAIDAIRAQDYPHFECFVVDNGSSDDSRAVIARHVGDDGRFTVVHLAENVGQLRAALGVFERLRGEYVACVDADDVLFRNFLAAHLQVHLALRAAVGFSSSNIVEMDAERNVLTGGRTGFALGTEGLAGGLKPPSEAMRIGTVSDAEYALLGEATCVLPHWEARWVWAPGTANMFRRSALALSLPDTSRIEGHAGWDNYFCPIVHLLGGSALVKRHLSAYRFHGRNVFARYPRILAVETSRRFAADRSAIQRRHVLLTLLSRADEFNWLLAGDRFWSTLDLLGQVEGVTPRIFFAKPEVGGIVSETLPGLLEVFGGVATLRYFCQRMGVRRAWRALRRAYAGRIPLRLQLAFARAAMR